MLNGKCAIITGGSRGIGEAISYHLASLGVNIAIIYSSNEERAKSVCEHCENSHKVKARYYKCDVSAYQECKEVVSRIKDDFPSIDILVNNAGITRDNLLPFMSEDDFDSVINTNLKGAFNMIKSVSSIFIRKRAGVIINISSISGIVGNAGQVNYSSSKAALLGLTKSVAKELSLRNIRCNAVAPGFIKTEMTKELESENLIDNIPLKRMGSASEVAHAVSFLIENEYITGEVIKVDGGLAM